MRTTIEMSSEHRARLLEIAARRGEKGFSKIVAEAVGNFLKADEDYQKKVRLALAQRGSISDEQGERMLRNVQEIRSSWR